MWRFGEALFLIYIPMLLVLALSILLSAFVGLKDVGVAIMMVSLGFGFPLLFAPTPIPYLIALTPLLIAKRWPILGIATSCLAVGAVAFLPSVISRYAVKEFSAEASRDSVSIDIGGAAKKIEIRNPDSGTLACDKTCTALLLSQQVDWVRFVFIRQPSNKIWNREFYVAGRGQQCRLPLAHPAPSCVVFGSDSGEAADLVIDNQRGSRPQSNEFPKSVMGDVPEHRIIATLAESQHNKVVFDEVSYDLPTFRMPTLITVHFSGMSSGGFELARDTYPENMLTIDHVFKALGYNPTD